MKPKTDRPDIICLGGGVESIPILKAVNDQNFNPIVIDRSINSPGVQWAIANPRRADAWVADCYNPTSVRMRTQRMLRWQSERHLTNPGRSLDIAGVLCCATDCPDTQALIAELLRTPTIGKRAAQLAKDKWLQNLWLREHNFLVPETELLTINTDPAVAEGFDVIKPVASRGARGVQRFTKDTYRASLIEALSESPLGSKRAIAQKWVEGVQLSTESVIRNGANIFTAVARRNYGRLPEFYPYVIEDGSDTPFHLKPEHHHNLCNLIANACLSMEWDNCTVKGDIVYDRDIFWIIELAPRLSGGYFCSHIIPLACGYDLVKEAICLAANQDFYRQKLGGTQFVCQRFVFPRLEWVGKRIDKLPPVPDADWFVYYANEGDIIRKVTRHSTRLAQCITTGTTPQNALGKCESVIESITNSIIVK